MVRGVSTADILPEVSLEYPWSVRKRAKVNVKYHSDYIPFSGTYTDDTCQDSKINLTKAVWWSNFDKEFDKKTKRANN